MIVGIFSFLLFLLSGNASCEVEPVYAGWTVGDQWNGDGPGTILRSTDSGETWTRQGEGQIADVYLQGVFAVDPYTAWVVGNPDDGYATIYHTTDGGSTWERKGSSNSVSADYVPDVNLVKVHAVGNDVWAVSKGAILHTNDGGETWKNHIPNGYEDTNLQGVYVVDSNTVWVTGGDNGTIIKTTDAGLHWTRQAYIFDEEQHEDAAFLGISVADAVTAWAVGKNNTLLKTIDGGATWIQDLNFGGLTDLNEVYAVSTSTVWVAADFVIYWTTDGGQSWESSDGLPGNIAWMGISAVSDQKAWCSNNGIAPGIGHTTDGGTTWMKIDQLNGVPLPPMVTISFATQPINPDYLINSLIEDVEQLVDDDFLNQGQGNALIVKLEQVLNPLDYNRNKSAVNVLNALLNQVDAFVRGGVLSPETGHDISEQVNDIIEMLIFPL